MTAEGIYIITLVIFAKKKQKKQESFICAFHQTLWVHSKLLAQLVLIEHQSNHIVPKSTLNNNASNW